MAAGLMVDRDDVGCRTSNGEGRLTPSVVIICIVAASAGLIFGYDIGVSGGVTAMEPFLQKFFPLVVKKMADAKQNQYCTFDSQALTAFTSSLYIAGLASSLVGGRVTASVGRRGTLIAGGVLFLMGSSLNAFAMNVGTLLFGRILLGFGIGLSNQPTMNFLASFFSGSKTCLAWSTLIFQHALSPTALSSAWDFHEMKKGGIVVCSTFVALVYIPEYCYGRSVTQST